MRVIAKTNHYKGVIMQDFFDIFDDDEDFESFEKFNKKSLKIEGKEPSLRTRDHQIRSARKERERAKQAALEEMEEEIE
jgi:hypothetical protein